MFVGEPGVGKTCILRALRHRLPQAGFRLTGSPTATMPLWGAATSTASFAWPWGSRPRPPRLRSSVFYAVSTHVEDVGKERVHPVFLLDEAHLLHQDVLDHLHILLNYQWDSRALLSLILVGLPELDARLALRRNRSLSSRLSRHLVIDALQPEDTAEYLRLRLQRAGCDRELFATDAVSMLHEAASGAHRDIDRLATTALREAARRKKRLVERDVLARMLDHDAATAT